MRKDKLTEIEKLSRRVSMLDTSNKATFLGYAVNHLSCHVAKPEVVLVNFWSHRLCINNRLLIVKPAITGCFKTNNLNRPVIFLNNHLNRPVFKF